MSKNYNQLSLEQRYQIEALLKAGINQKFIALQTGVHPSTICRELSRNIAKRGRTAGGYKAAKTGCLILRVSLLH
jgi:IS30 family transposase